MTFRMEEGTITRPIKLCYDTITENGMTHAL